MTLRVLSLGAGVQSTTLALMAACSEIEPPDCAIFADTQWEPREVYNHLDRLENLLPFPVHRVTQGSIQDGIRLGNSKRSGRFDPVPWYIRNHDGTRGLGRRECTAEYKLEPIRREIRRLLGKPYPAHISAGSVDLLLGISLDEIERVKPSRVKFLKNVYPLLDKGMRRYDCLLWLERHGYPKPAKSACIGCPFTSNAVWRDRRDNHPKEWEQAVEMDKHLRAMGRSSKGLEYMHRSCVPLDEVDLSVDDRQLDLFTNECEGMCGV